MTPALPRNRHADRGFERLYRAHVGDVYRYALALTGNAADAEDVAQMTFMNAYRALARGERPVKPQNWLIAITRNVCRQRFRQAARRPTEVVYEEDVAEALVASDEAPSAADIQRALGYLPLNQREALVMRELEGRPYADIAELLGLSVAAVETLLFRARRALREQLEGSLTCSEAEAALSLQIDGRLLRADAGALRGHLRECETCRHLARRLRAQRKGFRALAVVPLPPSLLSWFGAGGASVIGAGVAAKVAAVTVAAVVAGGGGYAIVRDSVVRHHQATPGTAAAASPVAKAAALAEAALARAAAKRHGHRKHPVTGGHAASRGSAAGAAAVHPVPPVHPATAVSARKSAAPVAHRKQPVRLRAVRKQMFPAAARACKKSTRTHALPATAASSPAASCPSPAPAHG